MAFHLLATWITVPMLFLYLNHNTLHLLGNTFSVLWFKFNPFSLEDFNNNKIFSKNMAARLA